MNLVQILDTPGQHLGLIEGLVGPLEVAVDVPQGYHPHCLAMIGHPHSLQGGTMSNKVVTTVVRMFRELGVPSIRFNFRGVGQSEGSYDAGIGESDDMCHLLHLCNRPESTIFFAGFSFGSYVAFRALTQYQATNAHPTGLITIAPPVNHYDYSAQVSAKTPWIVVQGVDDDVVPTSCVTDFVHQRSPQPILECIEETGHFFHGKLIELKLRLLKHVHGWVDEK